jgi:hypothetical protein
MDVSSSRIIVVAGMGLIRRNSPIWSIDVLKFKEVRIIFWNLHLFSGVFSFKLNDYLPVNIIGLNGRVVFDEVKLHQYLIIN